MKNKDKKLAKYVKGLSKALIMLSEEIEEHGFDKENKETMSKIGSTLLFEATAHVFRN